MCGIFGFSGFEDEALLQEMQRILEMRGPDDWGLYRNERTNVYLGHRRLSIIDLSESGKQPIFNKEGTVVLVFNGEIYNYQEWIEPLKAKGYVFKSRTDSEVLLYLYEEYGHEVFAHLQGMYAFCLYDLTKNQLFLARDPLGIKPLYYLAQDGAFVFASELKALVGAQQCHQQVDPTAISDYLSFLWCPHPRTPLESVKKLEPGHALLVENGLIVKKWAHYVLPTAKGAVHPYSDRQAIDQLDVLLSKIVSDHMMSDVPVGAFLSGGLDSSLIVALMRALNPTHSFKTYTIASENDAGVASDLPYAQAVADFLKVDLQKVEVTHDDVIQNLEQLIYILDEPLADPAPLNVAKIAQQSYRDGVKVLLSGAGGDDLFSGYRRHQSMVLDPYFRLMPRIFRKALVEFSRLLPANTAFFRKFRKGCSGLDQLMEWRLSGYFLWIEERVKLPLFLPEFRKKLEGYCSQARFVQVLQALPTSASWLDKVLSLETQFFLADHNLIYTDKASMSASVEVRVPYVDTRLVDFASHLDPCLKMRGFQTKWILKQVAERYLPKEVIYRPKTGFGAPIRKWVLRDFEPLFKHYLSQEAMQATGIFDFEQVQRLITQNRLGKLDAAYPIFSILCIQIWMFIFILNQKERVYETFSAAS